MGAWEYVGGVKRECGNVWRREEGVVMWEG